MRFLVSSLLWAGREHARVYYFVSFLATSYEAR
jgi:hypothetical protein